jgi:CRISPR-associated protein Cmr4
MESEEEPHMKERPFFLHALSPLHAGSGHAGDVIDLPIARMKATGIPFVPGSSVKGVLRDARRGADEATAEAVFGPSEPERAGDHAGALVVGDARLLALPVRSFRGTFAWATSPLLLALAKRDLGDLARNLTVPTLSGRGAKVARESACMHEKRLYLQDLDLPAEPSQEATDWASFLAPLGSPGKDIFTQRFAILDDDTMAFLWETATQVDTRVRLDSSTRTVAPRALWLEESLPPETLLIGLLAADRSRKKGVDMNPSQVLAFALPREEIVQFGGKATTGHGRCRIIPVGNPA